MSEAQPEDTVRQTLMRSMSVTDPFLYPHDAYDEGMAALCALVAERDTLRRLLASGLDTVQRTENTEEKR